MAAPRTKKTVTPTEIQHPVSIVVHTMVGAFEIDLGNATIKGISTIKDAIGISFYTLKASRQWSITDVVGTDFSFNCDHIVAVELRVGDQ